MNANDAGLVLVFIIYFRVALGMLFKAWHDPDLQHMPRLAVVAMYATCLLWPLLVVAFFLGWLLRPWRRT